MTGRRVLHLVRGAEVPGPLDEVGPADTVVMLGGYSGGVPPGCRCLVLGADAEIEGVDMESIVDLVFAHDVVMTW